MINNSTAKRTMREYESINEMLQASRTPSEANKALWEEVETAEKSNPMKWYGIDGAQAKVRELISLGWSAGASKLETRRDSVQGENIPAPVSMKRRRKWADMGDTLDITRTYAGQTDAWQKCERMPSNSRRYVEIMINLSISGATDGEVIFWRGAATLILADMMTNAGYAVKITGAVANERMYAEHMGRKSIDLFTVKDYAAPLDIESLASVVCLSGFFRLAWFQLACTHEDKINDTFGSVQKITDILKDIEPHQLADVDSISDKYDAKRWIEESIKKIQQGELKAA